VILSKSSGAIGSRDMKTYCGNLSMLQLIVADYMQFRNGNLQWNIFLIDRYMIGRWIWSLLS
jgi:hypothetical protein